MDVQGIQVSNIPLTRSGSGGRSKKDKLWSSRSVNDFLQLERLSSLGVGGKIDIGDAVLEHDYYKGLAETHERLFLSPRQRRDRDLRQQRMKWYILGVFSAFCGVVAYRSVMKWRKL